MADEENKQEEQQEAPAEESKEEAAEKEQKAEEAPAEESAAEEGEAVEVPEKFAGLIEQVENMTVLELHELVKVLEKKFGVSAQAVAAVAPGAAAGGEAAEEQSTFTVELKDGGAQKIQVIKVVKEVLGLGLKEAKDMVEGAPTTLKENVAKEEAEELKGKIEEAGGSVELK